MNGMWTCAACDASNEPHAILCATCGALSPKHARRERPGPVPEEPVPSAPEPRRFRGTVGEFTLKWTGVTVAGGVAALIASQSLFGVLFPMLLDPLGLSATRFVWALIYSTLTGGTLGFLQSWRLGRALERTDWTFWIWATIGGAAAGSLVSAVWPGTESPDLLEIVGRALFWGGATGAAMGFLQSRVLDRRAGGGWGTWVLVSMGASAAGSLAGGAVWYSLTAGVTPMEAGFLLAALAARSTGGALTAVLGGIFLATQLRRRYPPDAPTAPAS